MSDMVLAAIIAASATVFASFMHLKAAVARELAARAQSSVSGRKSRLPVFLLVAIVVGAATGGFAISQWVTEHQRATQLAVERELRARIDQMSRTESQLAATRAEITASVRRDIGLEGISVVANVAPCRPSLLVNTPALDASASRAAGQPLTSAETTVGPTTCTENEASAVTLCASVPAEATVDAIDLYARPVDSGIPWADARMVPGQARDHARFAENPVEIADGTASKQICQDFAHWSSESGRTARMVVRYSL